ncbi:MAG: excinuclease ABC subunit UvrC [Oscillospiraceae bacterium]|nr:excinuclease ABC subunit UvrC [Oscillospiraceae bacterium]
MKNTSGEVIYVGKAKRLKHRVSGYFHGEHEIKTKTMITKTTDFDVIVASSELEAMVLENSLIKRHKPRFNIMLKDDKTYPFIRIDIKSDYPSFTVANKISDDGARYFGPYGRRNTTKGIIDSVNKAMKLPGCGKKFPKDFGSGRPCLNFHMGVCAAYCKGDKSAEDYRRTVREALMIFEGKIRQLTEELEAGMNDAADRLLFESAAEIRDRIKAIRGLRDHQRVTALVFSDVDAVGYYRGVKSCISVLHYTAGELAGKDSELIDEPLEEDAVAVSALVRQYYSSRGTVPKTVLMPCEPDDREALEQFLNRISDRKISVEMPLKGEKQKLAEAAAVNAKEEALRETGDDQRRSMTLERLRKILDLACFPERIEAFDVSNLGDFGIVAAMTVFVNGKSRKRDYRKFKIKETEGQDDCRSMKEAVSRRYSNYFEGNEKFSELPQLLLIDGGRAQIQAAAEAVENTGLKIPIFGMVKDEKHRTKALISTDGRETGLTGIPAVFSFIGKIQEETHRFAVEYHRSLRNSAIGSVLDDIPGIGEIRRNDLLKHFKTVKAIRSASFEELCRVIPKNAAKAVILRFRERPEVAGLEERID